MLVHENKPNSEIEPLIAVKRDNIEQSFVQKRSTSLRLRKQFLSAGSLLNMLSGLRFEANVISENISQHLPFPPCTIPTHRFIAAPHKSK